MLDLPERAHFCRSSVAQQTYFVTTRVYKERNNRRKDLNMATQGQKASAAGTRAVETDLRFHLEDMGKNENGNPVVRVWFVEDGILKHPVATCIEQDGVFPSRYWQVEGPNKSLSVEANKAMLALD